MSPRRENGGSPELVGGLERVSGCVRRTGRPLGAAAGADGGRVEGCWERRTLWDQGWPLTTLPETSPGAAVGPLTPGSVHDAARAGSTEKSATFT